MISPLSMQFNQIEKKDEDNAQEQVGQAEGLASASHDIEYKYRKQRIVEHLEFIVFLSNLDDRGVVLLYLLFFEGYNRGIELHLTTLFLFILLLHGRLFRLFVLSLLLLVILISAALLLIEWVYSLLDKVD